jgi:hypothetical protein
MLAIRTVLCNKHYFLVVFSFSFFSLFDFLVKNLLYLDSFFRDDGEEIERRNLARRKYSGVPVPVPPSACLLAGCVM